MRPCGDDRDVTCGWRSLFPTSSFPHHLLPSSLHLWIDRQNWKSKWKGIKRKGDYFASQGVGIMSSLIDLIQTFQKWCTWNAHNFCHPGILVFSHLFVDQDFLSNSIPLKHQVFSYFQSVLSLIKASKQHGLCIVLIECRKSTRKPVKKGNFKTCVSNFMWYSQHVGSVMHILFYF